MLLMGPCETLNIEQTQPEYSRNLHEHCYGEQARVVAVVVSGGVHFAGSTGLSPLHVPFVLVGVTKLVLSQLSDTRLFSSPIKALDTHTVSHAHG